MSYTHHDRLTAIDATFLAVESVNAPMHVGAVALFDAAPLTKEDGSLDIARILSLSEASLRRIPRFRQKLARTPWFGQPVWVDDENFNLLYHVRHTALPHPGELRQLKRLAGRIFSQQLDRGKPLWEMWLVEGIEGGLFAIISKMHHCMVDGIAGVDLLTALMTVKPEEMSEAAERRWMPRPHPSGTELFLSELWHRAAFPLQLFPAAREALANPLRAWRSAVDAVEGLVEFVAVRPASSTPLNPDIGPHRRFDWSSFDLAALREIKNRLGGTINDVVLGIVAGAVRKFLRRRGVDPASIEFRSMIPVNIRTDAEHHALGNRVVTLFAKLPIGEGDPRKRLQAVIEATRQIKSSKQVRGGEVLEELSDATFTAVLVQFARLALRARPYNMVVTNVPGPPFAVQLLGAEMHEIYPLVPLAENQALGVALFSYNGKLFWGFNADWDAVPDLHDFVRAVENEFQILHRLAVEVPPRVEALPRSPKSQRRPPRAATPTRRRTSRASAVH